MMDTTDANAAAANEMRTPRVQRYILTVTRHLDLISAILLAFATVATAWCVYEATGWSGKQSTAFAQASSHRIESTREFTRSMQLLTIDADLFVQWVETYNRDDQELLAFYETNLMRPTFIPFLDDWVASDPRENPNARRNPLVDERYQQELFAESDQLQLEAEAMFDVAVDANRAADSYIMATVLFASVLFFAGISTKFRRAELQVALVSLALVTFAIGVVEVIRLPVH